MLSGIEISPQELAEAILRAGHMEIDGDSFTRVFDVASGGGGPPFVLYNGGRLVGESALKQALKKFSGLGRELGLEPPEEPSTPRRPPVRESASK